MKRQFAKFKIIWFQRDIRAKIYLNRGAAKFIKLKVWGLFKSFRCQITQLETKDSSVKTLGDALFAYNFQKVSKLFELNEQRERECGIQLKMCWMIQFSKTNFMFLVVTFASLLKISRRWEERFLWRSFAGNNLFISSIRERRFELNPRPWKQSKNFS